MRGKQFLRSDFEYHHSLLQCDPTPDTVRLYSPLFHAGLGFATACFLLCASLVGIESGLSLYSGVVGGMGLGFATLMVATARKVAFSCYKNLQGAPLLYIGRAGRRAAEYDSFVEAVAAQIRAARESV